MRFREYIPCALIKPSDKAFGSNSSYSLPKNKMDLRTSLLLVCVVYIPVIPSASFQRVRRQNSIAQGGGVSMSVALDPHNLRNPVNFADSVNMGFGVSAPGIKQSNSIGSSNTIGNGKAFGNSVGGANRRGVFGGGDANTRVASPHGLGSAITNNMAWQDSTGNAAGHGSATGQVGPMRRRHPDNF